MAEPSVNPNPPRPGAAVNTDGPGAAAPSTPAATPGPGGELPTDILTITGPLDTRRTITRREWDAYSPPARAGWTVVNAQGASSAPAGTPPGGVGPAAPPPAGPAPEPGLAAGLGPYYLQVIKDQQKRLGRNLTLNDFYALADPRNGLGLGAVKEVRAPTQADLAQLNLTGTKPQTIVEYANGFKVVLNGDSSKMKEGGDGFSADDATGFAFDPPKGKSQPEIDADTRLANAQAKLAEANAARQEALNSGNLPTREAEVQIAQAQAAVDKSTADAEAVRRALAAGRPEAEVQQILGNTAANLSQANSQAEQAAVARARLIHDATQSEIDRQYKEGLIDNETWRILTNYANLRWQADNTNTQTVLAAAGKGLEAELTQRNQNIALDNTRVNAANQGFSDDTKTATTMAQYIDPRIAENVLYNGLLGLSGLRKATVQDWGGLQTFAPVQTPDVIRQLGYNTPVTLRSLDTVEQIGQQVDQARQGRADRGTLTKPVPTPVITPTPVPTVTVPPPSIVTTAPSPAPAPTRISPPPSPVFVPAPPTDQQSRDTDYRTPQPQPSPLPPNEVSMAPPQQPAPYSPAPSLTQSNAILASTLQPIHYAQGGTPIAVRDLFGQVRPVVSRRYGWLG